MLLVLNVLLTMAMLMLLWILLWRELEVAEKYGGIVTTVSDRLDFTNNDDTAVVAIFMPLWC